MSDAIKKGKVFGAVTVGERGQVVIPAEMRKSYGINPGDKLIVFAKPTMIGMIPAEQFSRFLNQASEMMDKLNQKKI